MSLNEMKGTPFAQKYMTNTKISPDYFQAVQTVKYAKAQTVISTKNLVSANLVVPKKAVDLVANPIGTVLDTITGFWTLVGGTPEAKINTVTPYLPVGQEVVNSVKSTIEEQKKTQPGAKEFYTTPTVGATSITIPKIEIPDIFGGLKDLGKWALIGGIGLIAVLILSRRE